MYTISSAVTKKWKDLIDVEGLPPVRDVNRRGALAQMFENSERELGSAFAGSQFLFESAPTNSMGYSSSTAGTGQIDTFDPILISLLRRSMPNLVAYDLVGVQAMKGPTGLIFAMRTHYATSGNSNYQNGNAEAFYNEANTGFAGFGGGNVTANSTTGMFSLQGNSTFGSYYQYWLDANSAGPGGGFSSVSPGGAQNNVNQSATVTIPVASNNAGAGSYNYGGAINTSTLEGIGGNTSFDVFPEMAFSIEKVTATAGGRALKAEYSMELAQDLKAIHGLDAETELSNILSTELLAEINREIVRAVNITAVPGSQTDTTLAGQFDLDVDSNGRWLVEKFKGMYYQLEREANVIAKQTRRGKGNVMICTADIASALNAAGILSYTPKLASDLTVDDTGNTFVGTLTGGMKCYIDPYAIGGQYWTVGFKGANPMDAGIFYCPYVPLQMVRAVDPGTMQPKIGFKTRYAVVANPYAQGTTQGYGQLVQDSNKYYRRSIVLHLQ